MTKERCNVQGDAPSWWWFGIFICLFFKVCFQGLSVQGLREISQRVNKKLVYKHTERKQAIKMQLYSVFTSPILAPLRSAAAPFTLASECTLQHAEILGSRQ